MGLERAICNVPDSISRLKTLIDEKTVNNIPKIKIDDSPISRAMREVSPLHIRIDLNCSLPISTNIRE
jgi:hypothetical protein